MWTEMGDYLSRQYAGTDSTISRVSRDGKEGLIGKWDHKAKVAQRFLINSVFDPPKQIAMDIVLGRHFKTEICSEQNNFVERNLQMHEDNYSRIDHVSIGIATWNVEGLKPDNALDLKPWLFPAGQITPDIFVVGLQDVVGLSSTDYLKTTKAALK